MLSKPCILCLFLISFNEFNKTSALILDPLYNKLRSCVIICYESVNVVCQERLTQFENRIKPGVNVRGIMHSTMYEKVPFFFKRN